MILNENNGEPSSALPTSEDWLVEPGPVWYTPAPKNGRANGAALPARLVRSLGDSAWVALLRPEGGWQRVQARNARLAPRREVLELDHAWAAYQGTNGGAFTIGVRTVPGGAANGTPAHAPSPPTSPRAGLAIAAEPGWVRARDVALRCPDCEAASPKSGRTGRIFRNASALAQHGKWCPHRPSAPAAEPLRCPDCGATGGRRGIKFRSSRDLRHHQTMAHPALYPSIKPRAPLPKKYQPRTTPARPPSDAADSLQCPDCGATSGKTGRKFHRIRDLLRHQDVAHRLPDPAAGPVECPDCGATGGRRGTKFRDSSHLAQHRKRCARRAAQAAPPAESSATEVHQNGHAPARSAAPAAAPENGSAAQPSPAQAVRFCAGCGLNLEVIPMPVRFCPACGLGTAAIHAALSLARET